MSGGSVEVGTLCRSLPSKVFEVEFDVMYSAGEITQEMESIYLREVDGCPGYFHLLPLLMGNIYTQSFVTLSNILINAVKS